jgi:hypothetical protein
MLYTLTVLLDKPQTNPSMHIKGYHNNQLTLHELCYVVRHEAAVLLFFSV